MGGADVGAGRHRCDVGGERHKQAGGRGARAGRGHVDNRRDLGAEQALGDVPHGALQPAGRIQPDEQPGRLVALGAADGAAEVLGGNRRDGTVNLGGVEHPLGLCRRAGRLSRRGDSGESGCSKATPQPDQQEQHIQQAARRAANHRTILSPPAPHCRGGFLFRGYAAHRRVGNRGWGSQCPQFGVQHAATVRSLSGCDRLRDRRRFRCVGLNVRVNPCLPVRAEQPAHCVHDLLVCVYLVG